MTDRTPIVITGPTGWIGTAMLAHLAQRLGKRWSDDVVLFGSANRSITAPDGTVMPMRLLESMLPADLDGALVVHLAYLTKDKTALLGERQFTDTNIAIDDIVLDRLRSAQPRGVFVASSGAAALAASGRDRHPYGLTKLRQEDRFLEWAAKANVPTVVGRIYNLAGPYINKVEIYAISAFIAQAKASGTIRISARVPVFRSYLHVDDLCGLIVDAGRLGVGRDSPADFCGMETVEMIDIAEAIASCLGNNVTVERDSVDWHRPSIYLGDYTNTKILSMELGRPLFGFSSQVADTLRWMSN